MTRQRTYAMDHLRPCGCKVYPGHAIGCWTYEIAEVKIRMAGWRDKLFGSRCQAAMPRVSGSRIDPVGVVRFTGRCVLVEHENWIDHAVTSDWKGHLLVHRWTTDATSQTGEGLP